MGVFAAFICVVLLAGIVGPAHSFKITEFCPDPYLGEDPDEYLVLEGSGPLDGIMVTDNEGSFRFPPNATSDGRVVVALNGGEYMRSHGSYPDFEWLPATEEVPDVLTTGNLKMSNARDELLLYDQGKLVQEIAWPGDIHPREGQVHFLDGDSWDPRILLLGQSRFGSTSFPEVTGVAFISPENSRQVFEEAVNSASFEILVNVYEFTDIGLADLLCLARDRGVEITVLLEGGPVGGISAEERAVCRWLSENGITVNMMSAGEGFRPPYRFNHAKYLVIDRESVLVTSENFKTTGFPDAETSGNRGWGIWMKSRDLASYFIAVYEADSSGPWTVRYSGSGGVILPPGEQVSRNGPEPYHFGSARVTPVISPDTSNEILFLLDNATTTIEIEQAYITNSSPGIINPLLKSTLDASRRGVNVRILLDSYWYNIEDTADNDEVAAYVNQVAREENIPLAARCINLESGSLEKLHNKGVIVDKRKVLVSSVNWNMNSPNFNREAGVIIEDSGVAGYYLSAFDSDWNSSGGGTDRGADYIKYALFGIILLFLIGIWWNRRGR